MRCGLLVRPLLLRRAVSCPSMRSRSSALGNSTSMELPIESRYATVIHTIRSATLTPDRWTTGRLLLPPQGWEMRTSSSRPICMAGVWSRGNHWTQGHCSLSHSRSDDCSLRSDLYATVHFRAKSDILVRIRGKPVRCHANSIWASASLFLNNCRRRSSCPSSLMQPTNPEGIVHQEARASTPSSAEGT